jgi:acyl-CoA thioesterase
MLRLQPEGAGVYNVTQPSEAAEGRDVVFSGQLLAQMMMTGEPHSASEKVLRSVHAIFARSGTYTKPITLTVESMQAGRTWASDTVTAMQEGKLLTRALLLYSKVDPDLIRHGPVAPTVPDPASLPVTDWQAFPGAEVRGEDGGDSTTQVAWHRYRDPLKSQCANQGILTWATCGNLIGLAMRAHKSEVDISQAHRTLNTGVIAHTIHFFEGIDVSNWTLIVGEGTNASNGRVYGSGEVFSADGTHLASFQQDSMARRSDRALDPSRAM